MEPNRGKPLNDDAVDDLLRRSAITPSRDAGALAVQFAREVRDEMSEVIAVRRTHRTRWRAVLGAAAAVTALSGAGTVAAYQLSIAPFQTLEAGVGRASTGVPVTYTNSLGHEVRCLAFIEYRNLTSEQRDAIEDASRSDEWNGYGQRVLGELNLPDASPERQNEAVGEKVHQDLWEAARAALPGMVYMRDSDHPVFAGTSMSCAHPGGVDGRP